MTVRSMHTVLNDFAVKHMQVMVPEDIDVIVNVATAIAPAADEDTGRVTFNHVAQVDFWGCFPARGKESPTEVSLSHQLPLWYVKDGDTVPLAHVLDGLWEQAQFMALMRPALPALQEAYAEVVGPTEEDDDDDDTDTGQC